VPKLVADLDVHPLAAQEIEEAYEYYESQREGFGEKLNGSLRRISIRIFRSPNSSPMWRRDLSVRISKVKRYPYRQPYQLKTIRNPARLLPPTIPRILALAHTSRRPGYWARRIDPT
jgi:hypothetical protein